MDIQERLSQHFTLRELCKTSVRMENVPGVAQVENLRRVCRWLERLRYAVILLDISDESKEDFDELLLERKGAVMWLHFAVRPSGNRRRVRVIARI